MQNITKYYIVLRNVASVYRLYVDWARIKDVTVCLQSRNWSQDDSKMFLIRLLFGSISWHSMIFFFGSLHFAQFFFSTSNFFGSSTTDETSLVEMRIWCIKIGIVLTLHCKLSLVYWFYIWRWMKIPTLCIDMYTFPYSE